MFPRLIALCGRPGSGKTEVAKILRADYGYVISDDGLPLREIAMDHLGLTYNQCFTQEGKLEKLTLVGREWEARQVLGEIGNAFEEKFGADIIPYMSYRGQDPEQRYVMASARREQGAFWASKGALVIEVVNSYVPESKFGFDYYNPKNVHRQIHNPFDVSRHDPKLALENLRAEVKRMIFGH